MRFPTIIRVLFALSSWLLLVLTPPAYSQDDNPGQLITLTGAGQADLVTVHELTLRSTKGVRLTHGELDENFKAVEHYHVRLRPQSGSTDDFTGFTGDPRIGAVILVQMEANSQTIRVLGGPGLLLARGVDELTLRSADQIMGFLHTGGDIYLELFRNF